MKARDLGLTRARSADGDETPFAILLKRYRVATGLSQEEVAERSRLSVNALSALERGARRAPHRETVAALCAALELDGAARSDLESSARRARPRGIRSDLWSDPVATNLPRQTTTFLGRRSEIVAIRQLLETYSVVTITGAGGIGKTRTALELASMCAETYFGGVWFVDLAALREPSFLVSRVAEVLNVSHDGQGALGPLLAHLASRQLLLILDNCEHLISEAARMASQILAAAPRVRILATSRERLHIGGEAVYRLPTLSVPPARANLADARRYDSVALFADRAAMAERDFVLTDTCAPLVADICRRLDGIPLAIELAAARLPTLGLFQLHDRLSNQLAFLRGGRRDATPRQQTLLATIAWSHDLLDEPERALLRRLSIFSGSWSLEAAERICAGAPLSQPGIAAALGSLVEKSLVVTEDLASLMRYRLLESMRTFAQARLLDADEQEHMARMHAHWIADVADRAHRSVGSTPHLLWLATYRPELENARVAVNWALATGNEPILAGRIIAGLRAVWNNSGQESELRAFAEALLERIDPNRHAELVARLYRAIISSHRRSGTDFGEAAIRAHDALERVADREGLGHLYGSLATSLAESGKLRLAQTASKRGLAFFHQAGVEPPIVYAAFLTSYALIAFELEDNAGAKRSLDEADALTKNSKDDFWIGYVESARGVGLYAEGKPARSLQLARSILAKRRFPANGHEEAVVYVDLAAYRIKVGDHEKGLRSARYAAALTRGRYHYNFFAALHHVAAALALTGEAVTAARTLGYLSNLGQRHGWHGTLVERGSLELLSTSLSEQLDGEEIALARSAGSALTEDELLETIGLPLLM